MIYITFSFSSSMLLHKICAKDGILEAERVGGCENFIKKFN